MWWGNYLYKSVRLCIVWGLFQVTPPLRFFLIPLLLVIMIFTSFWSFSQCFSAGTRDHRRLCGSPVLCVGDAQWCRLPRAMRNPSNRLLLCHASQIAKEANTQEFQEWWKVVEGNCTVDCCVLGGCVSPSSKVSKVRWYRQQRNHPRRGRSNWVFTGSCAYKRVG